MIESISAITANAAALNVVKPQTTTVADFSQILGEGVSKLDSSLKAADQQLRAMAAGKEVAVHDVMISMEEARMNLMFMVEVRNRCVEAYQELMRMQL
jgi:flagellar hook-basal body complex protein FliE